MRKQVHKFSRSATDIWIDAQITDLKKIVDPNATVLLTDENVFNAHKKHFKGWNTIVLKAGEEYKIQSTADAVIETLIEMEADRSTTIVGIGGGVITDLAGYIASVYMRGLSFGFVPTSVLGMVDASIGGKNGIDVGEYKNLVGTIRQPSFILYDTLLLRSLPEKEWVNGFAEIIKHACILDSKLFAELEKNSLDRFRSGKKLMDSLVQRNINLKTKIVKNDEFEKGERRLLNFGHTIGHALEMQYELMHGEAISIGMVCACRISEQLTNFKDTERLVNLLDRYGLPASANFDRAKIFKLLKMDKKREKKQVNYVLLEKIGKAVVKPIELKKLEQIITGL